MKRYFAIIATMRTGSNLLETTLAQFPCLTCHGEAFNPAFPGKPRAETLLGYTVGARDEDPLAFLDHMIEAEPGQVPGFRLFAGHSARVLERVLTDPACARIVLWRDPLESWVSLQIARTTDQWILRNPERRIEAKIRFDPEAFAAYAEGIGQFYAEIRRRMQTTGTTAFHISYDELSNRETIEGLARYIGVRKMPARLEAQIARQNPGAIEDKLENPEALAAWRKGSVTAAAVAAERLAIQPRLWGAPGQVLAFAGLPGTERLTHALASGLGAQLGDLPLDQRPDRHVAAIVMHPATRLAAFAQAGETISDLLARAERAGPGDPLAPQVEHLAAWQRSLAIDRVLRAERLERDGKFLAADLGIAWQDCRAAIAAAIPAFPDPLPEAEAARIRARYNADFQAFGY